MRKDALQSLHDDSGHLSLRKTLAKVQEQFYPPQMFTDVKDRWANCVRCQEKRNAVPQMRAPLHPIVTTHPRVSDVGPSGVSCIP